MLRKYTLYIDVMNALFEETNSTHMLIFTEIICRIIIQDASEEV